MKKNVILGLSLAANIVLLTGIVKMKTQINNGEFYKVEGPESPGIAAGSADSADIAEVWYDNGYHIRYPRMNNKTIKVIDWPEEFSGVLGETGEIHSNMAFRQVSDTLKVEFEEQ